MSGFTPVAVAFATSEAAPSDLARRLLEHLEAEHGLDPNATSLARLIFDADGIEWIDTESIATGDTLESSLISERWIRASGAVKIGEWFHSAEAYVFPCSPSDRNPCCEIKLSSRAYEAVYDFQARGEGGFNDAAKRGLLRLSLGAADAIDALAFSVRFDDGELRPLEIREVLASLQAPEMRLGGNRPGLLTGVREERLSLDEVRAVWRSGEHVYRTTSGYTVLDLLQPGRTQSLENSA